MISDPCRGTSTTTGLASVVLRCLKKSGRLKKLFALRRRATLPRKIEVGYFMRRMDKCFENVVRSRLGETGTMKRIDFLFKFSS